MKGNNGRKAISLMCTLAFAMAAFMGFAIAAEEPVLTDPVASVDVNIGYVGDTFTFTVEGYGAGYNNANISASLEIDETDYPLVWNETNLEWNYEYVAAESGIFTTNVTVWDTNNVTNIVYDDTLMINVWEPVMYNDAYVAPTFAEDPEEPVTWDLIGAFTPAMDLDGDNLTLTTDNLTDWTVEVLDDYTWNVTPPLNFNGEIMVTITAADGLSGTAYHNFTFDVGAVNDEPTIDHIVIDDVEYAPELMNITTEVDEGGNATAWEWRNTVNLTLDEDGMISFQVDASDIEEGNFTYVFAMIEDQDDYVVENDIEENVTIPMNFTLTPGADAYGEFWGTMTVTDLDLTNPKSDEIYLWIQVAAVNDLPNITSVEVDNWEQEIGSTFVLTGAATDIDEDLLNYTWKLNDEIIGYEATLSYVPETVALLTITLVVDDGTVTVEDTIDINVTAVPIPPNQIPTIDTAAAANAEEVVEGEDLTLTVEASDADADDTLTITWYNGDVELGTGSPFTINTLEPGTYTITANITDGEATVTSEVTVTIKEKKDDEEDGFPIIIIVVIILAVIILAVILFFVFKGGKKEEEEMPEEPAPEEMPMEGEMPAEAPFEGEAYAAPEEPMSEQPVPEEPVPEQPVPEEPTVPAPPEAPPEPVAPPVPEEPPMPEAPPVPPAPPQ